MLKANGVNDIIMDLTLYFIAFIAYFLILVVASPQQDNWSPSADIQSVLPSALPSSPSNAGSGTNGNSGGLGNFGKGKLGYDAYKVAKTQLENAAHAIHH